MTHAEPQNLCGVYALLFGLVCLIVGGIAGARATPVRPPDPPPDT